MKTNKMDSNNNTESYNMKFTVLDILNDIIWFKPVFLFFKTTRLVKNYNQYNILKKDLLERLQIQKIVEQMTSTKMMKKKVEGIDTLEKKMNDVEDKINRLIKEQKRIKGNT